jgi:hypothetical protein
VARTLRSVPLLGSRRPCRHRASSFRTRSRSPAGVPSRRWSRARFRVTTPRCTALDLRAFFHRGVRCVRATLPSRDRSMLPWALDRLVPTLPRVSRCPALAGRFALRPEPLWRPQTRTSGEGRVFRPCLAPCDRRTAVPEGTTVRDRGGSGGSRRSRLGRIPDGPRRGCQWIRPERRSTASVRHPKACGCRRHRDASPKRLVRDPALAPKSGGRWFELLLSVLPRLPAYMMERPLAADTHARRRVHLRATRAHPRGMLRRTPLPNPEGLERRANRRRHPEVGPWRLVAPASPASWSAGSGPDSRRSHRDGRDSIRRRSLSPDPKIGLTGAEAPWVRSVRTSHLWWRSVASTEVPAPRWTVIHPRQPRPESALLPFRAHRSDPGTPTGVTRTGSDSNVSMVTSKNVSEDPFLSVRTVLPEWKPS